jgi:hypothetical protein
VHRFDAAAGWVDVRDGPPTLAGTTVTVTLTAGTDPAAVLRLVLAGTGATPVAGAPGPDGRPIPLAGVTGGPPGSVDLGVDAVFTIGGTP